MVVSIKDVARRAGVAISTVSKVLNHYPNVSEETKPKSASTGKDIIMSLLPLTGLLIYGVYVLVSKLLGIDFSARVNVGSMSFGIVEFICIIILK